MDSSTGRMGSSKIGLFYGLDGQLCRQDGQLYGQDGLLYRKSGLLYGQGGLFYGQDGQLCRQDGQLYGQDGLLYGQDGLLYGQDGGSSILISSFFFLFSIVTGSVPMLNSCQGSVQLGRGGGAPPPSFSSVFVSALKCRDLVL